MWWNRYHETHFLCKIKCWWFWHAISVNMVSFSRMSIPVYVSVSVVCECENRERNAIKTLKAISISSSDLAENGRAWDIPIGDKKKKKEKWMRIKNKTIQRCQNRFRSVWMYETVYWSRRLKTKCNYDDCYGSAAIFRIHHTLKIWYCTYLMQITNAPNRSCTHSTSTWPCIPRK